MYKQGKKKNKFMEDQAKKRTCLFIESKVRTYMHEHTLQEGIILEIKENKSLGDLK